MADIVTEVESLRDFVVDPTLYSRIWMQTMPAKYEAGQLSIRFTGGGTASETGYHYRLDREYQFVYFGTSELDCIRKGTVLQRKLNSKHAIKLKGSERYIRVGPFSLSQPFKTEGGEVFAIIGMLQAELREARDFSAEEVPKMGGITIEVKPKPPGSEPEVPKVAPDEDRGIPGVNDEPSEAPPEDGKKYPDKEFGIEIGNGACI